MLDKNKIRREIEKKEAENKFLNKEFFKFSDGFNTGYKKALINILKGEYNYES
jgi:hypothetical protein